MTGTNIPVDPQRPLRNLFQGIVGFPDEDALTRLERLAARAIHSRARVERREERANIQAQQRKAAVERRKINQMRAADYARDRRQDGTLTEGPTKREARAARTKARIAAKTSITTKEG